jgi:asparagine synthase (glutamine-hydrolysing)
MSGIAGLIRFDHGTVERRDLDRMAGALRAHGPDRAGVIVTGNAGLVHTLMRMTPEDAFDRQPWRSPNGHLISADIRLDNRDTILSRIGVSLQDGLSWPDSRIVLVAWEKLGDAIWPMLQGPFAVAIWSTAARTLTLARDHLGLHVVMWYRSPEFFAFATMPKGLFALPDVPRTLNESKFADFMVLNHSDLTTTVFNDIFRIPPAHFAKVSGDGSFTLPRYWSALDIKPIRLASDADYADGLYQVLNAAVRKQLRSTSPVGCYLSGGLDSSSVAALASRAVAEKNQSLSTYTQVPRRGFAGPVPSGRYADETPFIEAMKRDFSNLDVTYVFNDELDDFSDLERFFVALEAPVRNPNNLGWMLAIPRRAREKGVRVLLSGEHGNATISWNGWAQTAEHLLNGRLWITCRQLRQFYRTSSYSSWTAFEKLILEPLLPLPVADWVSRQARLKNPWELYSAIHPDFALETNVAQRARMAGHDFLARPRTGNRADGLIPADYSGDWNAAIKAATGVEVRDPTADLDVVSYCYGIPLEQFLAENTDRSLIRRAMWGISPREILVNQFNGLQSADWFEKLGHRRRELEQSVSELETVPSVSKMLDVPRMRKSLSNWPSGGWHTKKIIDDYQLALPRGIAGARFLKWVTNENRTNG